MLSLGLRQLISRQSKSMSKETYNYLSSQQNLGKNVIAKKT